MNLLDFTKDKITYIMDDWLNKWNKIFCIFHCLNIGFKELMEEFKESCGGNGNRLQRAKDGPLYPLW